MYTVLDNNNSFMKDLEKLHKRNPRENLYLIFTGKKNPNSKKTQDGIYDFLVKNGRASGTVKFKNGEREIYSHPVSSVGSLNKNMRIQFLTFINNPPPKLWTFHFGPKNTDYIGWITIDDDKKEIKLWKCGKHADSYSSY
jgi:hypothetical protein